MDLYPKVLIRPICGCCGSPMILGRSTGKYQSFFCFNATNGAKGCTNRGYKSARIIDEAVLGAVMATLFTEGFIADLTAGVNTRLAELARQPIPSTKKLEQEIANEDRQLAAKRERLQELQRAGRRPKAKSVRQADVVSALTKRRDLLQGDVGVVAQVLKALVGDVVIESRQIEGQAKPQVVARFSIDAMPALAAIDRGTACEADGGSWPVVCSEQRAGRTGQEPSKEVVVPLLRKCLLASGDQPVTPPTDSPPPQA